MKDELDSLGQSLYGISLGIDCARARLEREQLEEVRQALAYLARATAEGLSQLRALKAKLPGAANIPE